MSAPVEELPKVLLPVENPPVAIQRSAFVELQVSVEDLPLSMMFGFAESVTIGGTHASILQLWLVEPLHVAPPFVGEGFVQLLVWVPPPQLTEQLEKFDQPPSVGAHTV